MKLPRSKTDDVRLSHARELGGAQRSGYVAFSLYSGGKLIGVDVMVSMEDDEDVHPYRHKVRGEGELAGWEFS